MTYSERGLTLIEVLVALAVFAVVAVGALGVVGATTTGGFLETFPTAFVSERNAKDISVAAVSLQAFQEHLAGRDDSTWSSVLSTWSAGTREMTYCVQPGGTSCGGSIPLIPGGFGSYPTPGIQPYQLDWTKLEVLIQKWYWDCAAKEYSPSSSVTATDDVLIRVQSTLTWNWKGQTRTLATSGRDLDRFVPFRPTIPFPMTTTCSP